MAQPIAPCFWFDGNAEEAVSYYVSVVDNAKILHIDRYSAVGPDPDAPVAFIEFQINGQPFQAINGGRNSPSPRRSRSRSSAPTRRRSIATGTASPTAASRSSAVGSRTGTASPGRSCPERSTTCSVTVTGCVRAG